MKIVGGLGLQRESEALQGGGRAGSRPLTNAAEPVTFPNHRPVLEDQKLRWSLGCSRMMVWCPQVPSCAVGGLGWRIGRHKQFKNLL